VEGKELPMESTNISLPEPLKQFVDGQVSTGRYSSASESVRDLICADEQRKAEAQLEAKLLEGLNGAESPLTPADWSAIRNEALDQVEARKLKS
jgi:antitoxin ParD1/3/4